MKLIIQVPCYNEAQTLEIALNHLPKHIDGIDEIEYLIINDGSRDDTVKVAKNWRELCSQFPDEPRTGKGVHGRAGCLPAKRCGYHCQYRC